ncbi:leucyl/phenylalanyl-tRNA--protein transferase [Psychromonas sp.]|nr:leucyl/phenylalanyl-tRNA--protein transferase [Psychromonas sp.]
MRKILTALSETDIQFPNPEKALDEPDGLLAIGGDLSPSRLLNAYQHAIFPWFSEGDPILWWSPSERAVIVPQNIYISKSMARFIRQTTLTVTINYAFEAVINACSLPRKTQAGTWISPAIKRAYQTLHELGHAHSIEVWNESQLVGGLYGVNIGGVFCGESMFHTQTNASKFAFISLCQHFALNNGGLIDCQMMTPHLQSLGVKANTRDDFIKQLKQYKSTKLLSQCWVRKKLTR